MYEHILYEVQDGMALITLNRPERLNAWSPQMATELKEAALAANADSAVVAIVVTGAGKGFCAGADLSSLSNLVSSNTGQDTSGDSEETLSALAGSDPETNNTNNDNFNGTFSYLMALDKPVIAAINGAVAGMAVPLVLCCDLRFMADDAVILTAFSQRGLVAEFGTSWLLPRQVGAAHAFDLLFSSRKVNGPEAERMGFVNRSMPGEELLPFVRDYVANLVKYSAPSSMAIMKQQVYTQLHDRFGAAERDAAKLMAESFRRPDFTEGVQSFLEQREPQFNRLPSTDQ